MPVNYSQASHQHLDFDLPQQPGYARRDGPSLLAELVESIRSGKPPAITGHDGLKALEVVEAIYQSAESGQSVKLGLAIGGWGLGLGIWILRQTRSMHHRLAIDSPREGGHSLTPSRARHEEFRCLLTSSATRDIAAGRREDRC